MSIEIVIQKALDSKKGALIGRNGTIELEQMIEINPFRLHLLQNNAGIFPIAIHNQFYKWQQQSIDATKSADVLVTGWYKPLKEVEKAALEKWQVKAIPISLRAIEPYYVESSKQWTKLLEGHSVAVITSFSGSAKKQIEKGADAIWGSRGVLPKNVEWHWIQTGYPKCVTKSNVFLEWPDGINDWSQAAEYIVKEVMKSGARFALIGCGGLGMPIAKMLKDRGVISIVMGGEIQILFGIKGKRWANHSVISKFWNDAWVWPLKEETPDMASSIEGGCYWL